RQALDGLDGDGGLPALDEHVLHQDLAGEPVDAVDAHRVRTAHTVGTGPAEGQRAVDVPLDVVQQVQHAVPGQRRNPVGLPVHVLVDLRVVPEDLDVDHGSAFLHRRSIRIQVGGPVLVLVRSGGGHQYLRSIGWYRVMTTGL